jgi:hypothetical protein
VNAALGDIDGVLGFQIDPYLDDRQQSTRIELLSEENSAWGDCGCCCCGYGLLDLQVWMWVGAPDISHQCEDWHQFLYTVGIHIKSFRAIFLCVDHNWGIRRMKLVCTQKIHNMVGRIESPISENSIFEFQLFSQQSLGWNRENCDRNP